MPRALDWWPHSQIYSFAGDWVFAGAEHVKLMYLPGIEDSVPRPTSAIAKPNAQAEAEADQRNSPQPAVK
jgi:hypothetical protein